MDQGINAKLINSVGRIVLYPGLDTRFPQYFSLSLPYFLDALTQEGSRAALPQRNRTQATYVVLNFLVAQLKRAKRNIGFIVYFV